MMSIWFVTPAWKRYGLSAVCFEQWSQVQATLAERGVDLRVVVIADDDNIELAQAFGFDTIEQDNRWLGRKFNDGIEYAAAQGAEWIVPIGSDTWISPDYLAPLPQAGNVRGSRVCCVVTPERLAELRVGRFGVGPFMFHRSLLAPTYRPAGEHLHRGIDGSTLRGLGEINWERRDISPYQHIGFRGTPHLTPYKGLWRAWGVRQYDDPWARLADHYPAALIEAAQAALA